ncbi:AAA family ATPase [Haematospirillum sp. H1815]|uniref:AAA family ATPase n=1 Tax=Haematospirillum sp. H1815 TaxID=2723108 RepID=UPI001438E5C1|nr:AAA family ATPase [Haematospirillum sp. H1815]NKD77284.1 AAA family ATPase [Haematospirillum sp. H1815]
MKTSTPGDLMDLSADVLRDIRKRRGQTQAEFAAFLNKELSRNYSPPMISRWEQGKEPVPSIVRLFLVGSSATVQEPVCEQPLVLALANQKGGVAKTTSSINIAWALARAGHATLLVDFDHQSNATAGLGLNNYELDASGRTIASVMLDNLPVNDAVVRVRDDIPLFLLPGGSRLAEADLVLTREIGGEWVLKETLAPLAGRFSFIVIDCGPHLGPTTVNALTAADYVLIPSDPTPWSTRGIPLILRAIDRIRRRIRPGLEILGILPTRVDPRLVQDRETMQELHDIFGSAVPILDPVISTTYYNHAAAAGQPILELYPGARGVSVYVDLAENLIALAAARHVSVPPVPAHPVPAET